MKLRSLDDVNLLELNVIGRDVLTQLLIEGSYVRYEGKKRAARVSDWELPTKKSYYCDVSPVEIEDALKAGH